MPHPGERRRRTSGQHAGHRPDRAVEPDLADVDDVAHDADLDELHRGGDGDEDGEVEAGADLALPRRREVDGDAALAHRHLLDERGGGLDPVGRLLDGRVAEAADREARQAGATCASTSTTNPCTPRSPTDRVRPRPITAHPPQVLEPGPARRAAAGSR